MDAYTGQDVLQMTDYQGDWTLSDFADGTVAELTAPNELSSMTTGYNGNGLAAHNEPGRQRTLALRLVKGSGDDSRLNETFEFWKRRDVRFRPLSCVLTKNIGHSDGSITAEKITCKFGIPAAPPVSAIDVAGGTEQVVSVYTVNFADNERSI